MNDMRKLMETVEPLFENNAEISPYFKRYLRQAGFDVRVKTMWNGILTKAIQIQLNTSPGERPNPKRQEAFFQTVLQAFNEKGLQGEVYKTYPQEARIEYVSKEPGAMAKEIK